MSLRFVGKYADGLVEFGKDFLQFGIGLLYYEGGEVLGLALLHLSGLHNVGVAVAIGIEPADKKAATKCLTAVACFANIEQYVRVGGEKGLNQQQDGLAKLLVERRGLMALITDGKLVGASLPDRVVVHETDDEDLAAVGLNEVVAAVLRPDLVGSEAVDACQVKCVHAFRCSVEVVPDGFFFISCSAWLIFNKGSLLHDKGSLLHDKGSLLHDRGWLSKWQGSGELQIRLNRR